MMRATFRSNIDGALLEFVDVVSLSFSFGVIKVIADHEVVSLDANSWSFVIAES